MAETVTNICIGDAKVFIGTASTTAPADTVAYGTDWGGAWTHAGLTIGGATWSPSVERKDIMVDTHNAPVYAVPTAESHTFTLNLAESTLANLQKVMGLGTLTAGGTETTLGFGSSQYLTWYAIGLEGLAPGSTGATTKYRRAIIWKALMDGGIEYAFQKDNEAILAVTFTAFADLSKTAGERILKVIDEN